MERGKGIAVKAGMLAYPLPLFRFFNRKGKQTPKKIF